MGTTWAPMTRAQDSPKNAHAAATQQPLYGEYRGVRVGMGQQEARAKMGEPLQKTDDLDWYVISEHETAQIAYDSERKVKALSIDYTGGAGAPDYKAVVGPDVEVRPDGAIYKLVRYESLGFWVSYNRSAGTVPVVTITIQKSM
jgi:hypothetical protein